MAGLTLPLPRKRKVVPSETSSDSSKKSLSSAISDASKRAAKKARTITTSVKNSIKKAVSPRRGKRPENDDDDAASATSIPDTSPPASSRGPASTAMSIIDIDDGDDGPSTSKANKKIMKKLQDQLTKSINRWASHNYAYYEQRPRIDIDDDGTVYHVFVCHKCSWKKRRRATGSDSGSTGQLKKHAQKCWDAKLVANISKAKDLKSAREIISKHKIVNDGQLTHLFRRVKGVESFSTEAPTSAEIRVTIARWVAESLRPFKVVKDRGLRWLLRTGRPEYYIPDPSTVSRDVKLLHEVARKKLAEELQAYEGVLAFAIDCWTSPNHRPWMSITVSFVRDGELISIILDFIELPTSHMGKNMAIAFQKVMVDYEIEDKVGTVTGDNASNNDIFHDELKILNTFYRGCASQVRCFAHILNLTAKGILRQFDPPKKNKNEPHTTDDINDDEENIAKEEFQRLAEDLEMEDLESRLLDVEENGIRTSDDDDELPDVLAEMTRGERKTWAEDVRPIRMALLKARKITFKIINSPTILLSNWYKLLKTLGLEEKTLPRDVPTRWNSTHDMLHVFLQYQEPITAFLADRGNNLRAYELDKAEWAMLAELVKVLSILRDSMLYYSTDCPNIASVIPAMDYIDSVLATSQVDAKSFSPAIRVALSIGKRVMNKYYGRTDESDVYRIAIVLHPSHKLDYFCRLNWPESWIDGALNVTRSLWETRYQTRAIAGTSAALEEVAQPSGTRRELNQFAEVMRRQVQVASNETDELARYLADSRVTTEDPLRWWLGNRSTYPHLAQMAINFHCIPATAVLVERTFSRGRILISHLRNRLRNTTVRALMCLGDWSRHRILDERMLIQAIMQVQGLAVAPTDEDLIDDEIYMFD